MLVSHRHRFIYTKTIKTAGTSVESYFEPHCMKDGEWEMSHARAEYVSDAGIVGFRGGVRPAGCRWWNHMKAAEVKRMVGVERWDDYFKFCVVRNPFERVASQFYFEHHHLGAQGFDADHAHIFERWLTTAQLPRDIDQYTIDGRLCMDHFIRHEDLAAGMAAVCNALQLPWEPGRLPHFKSDFRPTLATVGRLYTPAARQAVQRAFARELDLLGYGFPG